MCSACTTRARSLQASVSLLCVCVCIHFRLVQLSVCVKELFISLLLCVFACTARARSLYTLPRFCSIDVCLCLHCFPELALLRAIVARVVGCRGREHTHGVLPCSVVPQLRGIGWACIGLKFEIILCAFVVISRFEMAFSVACVH